MFHIKLKLVLFTIFSLVLASSEYVNSESTKENSKTNTATTITSRAQSKNTFELDGLQTDATTFSYPTCQKFSTYLTTSSAYYYSTCGNAVDYSFYLPANTPLSYFEKLARSSLNNTAIAILPNACQVAIKKLVCSNIYLKCYPGANPADSTETGWNPYIYSDIPVNFPVPFERPCKSVCTNVNSECLGVLSLLGLSQNCAATRDYSNNLVSQLPYQYDSSNNIANCNPMSASFSIGSTEEPYLGAATGQCAGIVDTLYVVPASKIQSTLAPLQPSYVTQTIIELELQQQFSKIPVFVSTDCQFALKKYFCRSAMPKPVSLTIEEAFADAGLSSKLPLLSLFGVNVSVFETSTVYYPSFPSQEVCLNYADVCGAFIELAGNPALEPNCDGTTTLGAQTVKLYPNSTQTIIEFQTTLTTPSGPVTLSVPFKSQPDDVSTATQTSSYVTYCPQGFVVPNDPSDDRINWVDGTGCAVECRTPILTDVEFNAMDLAMHIVAVVGIALTTFVLIIYLSDERKRREEQTVILFAFFALINAISYTILRATPGARTCANNAVGIAYGDGANICSITSFINMYCIFACCVAWMLFSVDKFLKIVLGFNALMLREFNVAAVLIYPLIAIIGAAVLKLWGYSNGPKLCVFSGNNPHDFNVIAIFIIPLIILVAISFLAKVVVIFIVTCTKKRRDISSKSIRKFNSQRGTALVSINNRQVILGEDDQSSTIVPTEVTQAPKRLDNKKVAEMIYDMNDIEYDHSVWDLITAITFNLVFFMLWVTSLYYRVRGYTDYYKQRNSFYDWAGCAFENFQYDSQDWHKQCGLHAHYRQPYGLELTYYLFIGGQGTLFGAIFLANPQLWIDLYDKYCRRNDEKENQNDGFIEVPTKSTDETKSNADKTDKAKLTRRETANVELGEVFDDKDVDDSDHGVHRTEKVNNQDFDDENNGSI